MFTVVGFFFGLFAMGIFLNSRIDITEMSAPVSYNQVVVGPLIVSTVICGRETCLLSLFDNDVFSAIFQVHIFTIISTLSDLKGFFFSWLSVQLSLGAVEELDSSFLT